MLKKPICSGDTHTSWQQRAMITATQLSANCQTGHMVCTGTHSMHIARFASHRSGPIAAGGVQCNVLQPIAQALQCSRFCNTVQGLQCTEVLQCRCSAVRSGVGGLDLGSGHAALHAAVHQWAHSKADFLLFVPLHCKIPVTLFGNTSLVQHIWQSM